ncbi:MAG: aspartate aminotransferase family protein [Gemmatimonadota bacterium]
MTTPPTPRSAILYERALRVLPGGASRNTILRHPHPPYADRGEGCWVVDVDGVRRLDFSNNMASLIHGYAHPRIVEAVTAQLGRGTAFMMATEAEVAYAELMCARSTAFEKIRFVNSGTEAVMACLKAARARTGRPKIAKAEGAYHGPYDYAEVSQTADPSTWGDVAAPSSVPVAKGTPRSALDDVVVFPFNDTERALALLDAHAAEIACVLVDPMPHRVGLVPAGREFIAALHAWTRRHGALLVFDEVITFRSEHGGCQEWYEQRPDLTALGKIIGGGFPVGAITGRADVMDVLDPLAATTPFPLSGTFSANPVTMVAGRTAMELFDRAEVRRLNALGDRARAQIAEAIRTADVPFSVTGAGSIFRIHVRPRPPADYRECYVGPAGQRVIRALLDRCFDNGLMLINTFSGTLSTPMTAAEIDRLSEVLLEAFREYREMALALHTGEGAAGR